jgi:DNA-directed RNA polymerase subunit RPC12/RpoP
LGACREREESVKLEAMVQFTCEHCHRRLSIADAHAGKKGKCPYCGRPVFIPAPGPIPPDAAEHSHKPNPAAKWSTQDAALLDIAHLPSGSPAESGRGMPSAGVAQKQAGGASAEEEVVEPPVSFLQALAYPANLDGLVQIAAFFFALWLVEVFGGLLGALARQYGSLLVMIVQAFVVGYVVYYIGYCVYDSAQGGRHAPTISPAHLVDLGELFSQMVLLAAALAVCFWPAALYRGLTGRADAWFWTLGAVGAFFWPMTLLTAVLFDGVDALNPLLIVRSILTTLPAYLALLVHLSVPGGMLLALSLTLARMPVVRVLAPAAYLYLLLVGAHLLGRFYRRHKDRLEWGL